MEQVNFTEEYLKQLIEEEKIIVEPPKKSLKELGHYFRNGFELKSIDAKRFYSVFIRIHRDFRENFSIGLIYKPFERESFQLVRFNGNHGESLTGLLPYDIHRDFHIHKITAEAIENGLSEPDKSFVTKDYASYEQAICAFCKFVNIKEFEKFFENCSQVSLFDGV